MQISEGVIHTHPLTCIIPHIPLSLLHLNANCSELSREKLFKASFKLFFLTENGNYFTWYSLSIFSLAKSLQLNLEISAT